jgi:pimeloyl-ACP methyl ester carboxylesterase
MMRTVTSNDGTTIAFDQSGAGPAVILVGGALSDRAGAAQVAALLAQHYTAINFDRRGRGDSGDTQPYAVEREVEDIAALINAVGGSACVFGGSSGAALALEAANRGLPITKLALYEPPFIVDDARKPIPEGYVAHLGELATSRRRGEAVEYFLANAVEVPSEALAQMRQAPMWPAMEAMAHTLAYDGAIMEGNMAGRPFSPGQWAAVTIPTLVMDGGDSPLWMHHAAQAVADILSNARRITLAGQTHAVDPNLLVPVLVKFFAD